MAFKQELKSNDVKQWLKIVTNIRCVLGLEVVLSIHTQVLACCFLAPLIWAELALTLD